MLKGSKKKIIDIERNIKLQSIIETVLLKNNSFKAVWGVQHPQSVEEVNPHHRQVLDLKQGTFCSIHYSCIPYICAQEV